MQNAHCPQPLPAHCPQEPLKNQYLSGVTLGCPYCWCQRLALRMCRPALAFERWHLGGIFVKPLMGGLFIMLIFNDLIDFFY
jgi:hypothetical protein